MRDKLLLIAEDSDNDFFFLERALKRLPAPPTYVRVSTGIEVIEYIKDHSPNLILLDINMPLMRGDQCLEEIQSTPKAYIPVVMYSSLTDLDSIKKLLETANSYLVKPKTIQGYRDMVASLCEYWFQHTVTP